MAWTWRRAISGVMVVLHQHCTIVLGSFTEATLTQKSKGNPNQDEIHTSAMFGLIYLAIITFAATMPTLVPLSWHHSS